MPVSVSANMSLPIPVVGQEPGPQYATDVNNSLTIIDGHTHLNGSGVPITPGAININTALTMNNYALTNIGVLTLYPQTMTPADSSLYEAGVDLYFVDGNGNNIRITQSGSVAGAAGTITGLPSGTASASFAAGTFTFQSATATAANIDAGSYVFRNATPSSYGLTLEPPNAMGANYTLTLPTLPPAQQIMTLDSAGNMAAPYTVDGSTIVINSNVIEVGPLGITAAQIANGTITGTQVGTQALFESNLPALNSSISGSSGTFQSTSTTPVLVLSTSLTCSGYRPVVVSLVSDGSSANGGGSWGTGVTITGSSTITGIYTAASTLVFYRDGSPIAYYAQNKREHISITGPGALQELITLPSGFLDTAPSAGSHTYALYAYSQSSGIGYPGQVQVYSAKLLVYEI